MRKLLLTVITALAVAAAAAVTLVAVAPARASSGTAGVIGAGRLASFGDPTVRLFAYQPASTAQGQFALVYPDGTQVIGAARCLSVSGRTAYLTARITVAKGPRIQPENWSVGNYIVIGIQDSGLVAPDLLNFSPGFAANPGCGPNGAATPVFPTVTGQFRVSGG